MWSNLNCLINLILTKVGIVRGYHSASVGGVGGWVDGVGGVEKLILKLTSASTGVGVEAWAELGNYSWVKLIYIKR